MIMIRISFDRVPLYVADTATRLTASVASLQTAPQFPGRKMSLTGWMRPNNGVPDAASVSQILDLLVVHAEVVRDLVHDRAADLGA